MALQTPPEIPTLDILRSVRMVVNTIIATLITDTELTDNGFKLKTSAGDELQVDLSGIFLKRGESDDITNVPFASETQTGRIAISTAGMAQELLDDTTALTPAKLLIALTAMGLLKFDLNNQQEGDLLTLEASDDGFSARNISFTQYINSRSDAEIQALCTRLQSIGCGGGSTPQPTLNLRIAAHFEEQAIAIEALPNKAAMDKNVCDNVAGWVSSSTQYPAIARIVCDGQTVGYATATLPRTDVKNALNAEGANTTKTTFGFVWEKPSMYRDGQAHTWQVFVGDTSVEATDYNDPQTTTCGEPTTPDPYVVSVRQSILNSITKNGVSVTVSLIEKLNTGEERPYTGTATPYWSAAGDPAGIVLVPNPENKTVSVSATNAATVALFQLECSLAPSQQVQVLAGICTRPTGLTTFELSWHFIPDGGFARLYTTLDDANATAGQAIDGSAPGNLDLRIAQAANLNVGTPFFLGDSSSCEKLGNNIYSVFDSSGGNTIKKAIQVVDGVIVAVKDSTYTSPTCTTHAKLTQAEYDAHTLVFVIYQYVSASGIRRAFVTRAEALGLASTIGNMSGERAGLNTKVCFPEALSVGNVLYGDNRTEHIADNSWALWPVEAGWWISDFVSATNFYLLQTDACGNIITREHITL